MTYLHMLSALQGGPSIHQAGSLGSNHLCPKLYAQPVMPPSQYLGGGGGNLGSMDPWNPLSKGRAKAISLQTSTPIH